MKKTVLLYEPMLHGHRGVLLGYYREALRQAGYRTVEHTTLLPGHESAALVDELDQLAARSGCDIIHVLTFEGLGPRWLRYPSFRRRGSRPLVASYYLYDNLYKPIQGLMWDMLFARGLLDRILVSDDFLSERLIPGWRRSRLGYVPDPWDPAAFSSMPRLRAKEQIGLPLDRPVFLLFGALKPRKGLDILLAAAERLRRQNIRFLLLLAGQLAPDFKEGAASSAIARLKNEGLLRVDDGFVDESAVSAYFHAADFVVCPYPRSFKVSSNVFTRACAAGTPAIVPSHGVVGEIVHRQGAGLLFETDSAEDLARCMRTAAEQRSGTGHQEIVASGYKLAAGKTIECFSRAVSVAYRPIRCLI